jgi:hypothetical protein
MRRHCDVQKIIYPARAARPHKGVRVYRGADLEQLVH